jgi:hypothetical protein
MVLDVVVDDLEEVAKSWRKLRRHVNRIKKAFEERRAGESIEVDQELLDAVDRLSTIIRDCPSVVSGGPHPVRSIAPCGRPHAGPRGGAGCVRPQADR